MKSKVVAALALAVSAVLLAACGSTVAGSAVIGSTPVVSGSAAPVPSSGSTDTASPVPSTGASSTGASSPGAPSTEPSTPGTDSSPSGSSPADPAPSTGSSVTATTAGDDQLFPTTPISIPATPSTPQSAATLEGRRMASWVLLPSDYDPAYHIDKSGFGTAPMKGPQALSSLFFDAPVPAVAERYGMITGFRTARNTAEGDELVICVMEFPDADKAAKASKAMAAAARTKEQDTAPANIPGMPTAYGWTGRYNTLDSRYLHTFYASGAQVIYLWMQTAIKGPKYLHAEFPKIYAAQVAELKTFRPVPKKDLMSQKLDPEGLLARTLPSAPGEGTVIDGTYPAKGFLHFMIDPRADKKLYAATGVDLVATNGSTVYRAKDALGAKAVVDDFAAQIGVNSPKMTRMTAPPGADYTRCLQDTLGASYYCVAQYGRYAVEIRQPDETSMAKAVAAQGALLAGF